MDEDKKIPVDVAFVVKKNSMNIASYRIRCHKIINLFSENGIRAKLYEKGDKANVIILSKFYDENAIEVILDSKKNDSKIILDLCDNHFIDNNKKNKIISIINYVDIITVSSEYLCNEVFKHTGRNSIVIQDLIEDYNYKRDNFFNSILEKYIDYYYGKNKNNLTNIVWFGNAKNSFNGGGMNDLLKIKDIVNSAPVNYRLTIVSNSFLNYLKIKKNFKIKTKYFPFNIYLMKKILSLNKICIIPIQKDDFSMSKSSNRVETALFFNLEVWADEIPAYKIYSEYIHINDWSNFGINFIKKKINFEERNSKIIKKWLEVII